MAMRNALHEISLRCDDIERTLAKIKMKQVTRKVVNVNTNKPGMKYVGENENVEGKIVEATEASYWIIT